MSKDNPFRDRAMFALHEKLHPDTWEHKIIAKDGARFGYILINKDLKLFDLLTLRQDLDIIIEMLTDYEATLKEPDGITF